MAYKRIQVGSVLKSKDSSQPDYIKIENDVVLKKGDILNLESKKSKLAQLEKNVEAGKLSEETAAKIREGIEKTPDFVRFSIVKVTKD
jgi:uncharacterized Zn finger protein